MTSKLRLLVVDDSIFMLMAIRAMVKLDPGIEIVGEARDGAEGAAAVLALRPDIVTMDVNMPGLNGIEATRRIMAEAPTAIVMLSSMTERGRAATAEALAAGAIDFTPKSMSAMDIDLGTIARQVSDKIRFWGETTGVMAGHGPVLPTLPAGTDLLALMGGAGGPLAIGAALRGLPPADIPVLVAVDTLSPANTAPFVDYLGRATAWPVRLATQRGALAPGVVTVVPGGRAATVAKGEDGFCTLFRPGDEDKLAASLVAVAAAPQLAFVGAAPRWIKGLAAAPAPAGAVWVQASGTTDAADPQAGLAALGLPTLVMGRGQAAATVRAA